MTTNATSFVTSLQYARSEAIKRKESISITASNAGVNTNEWGTGWTVSDSGGNALRVVETTCGATTMDETTDSTTNPNDTTDNDTVFVYRPTGFIDSPGTVNICDDRTGETGRQITISVTGRPNTNSSFSCS